VVMRYYRDRKLTNFAVLTATDASGKNFDDSLDAVLTVPEFKGLKVVVHEHMNPTDISVAAQLAHVKASNAQVLLTFVAGTGFGVVLHGISDAGLDLPVFATGSIMSPGQMQQYGSLVPKELVVDAFRGAEVPDPTARGKVRDAQAVYTQAITKAGYKPNAFHANVWDPMMLLVDALRALGPNATGAQVRDYIEHVRGWSGIEGAYDFTSGKQYGIGEDGVALFRWDKTSQNWVETATGHS
jgi:branched-chain amino acid transport system substrate-binding protein